MLYSKNTFSRLGLFVVFFFLITPFSNADFLKGVDALLNEDEEIALDNLKQSAENGHSGAQFELGYYYLFKDRALSTEWFRRSFENGNPLGAHHSAFWNPGGPESLELYKKSALAGVVESQLALGLILSPERLGWDDIDVNEEESLKWYQKAADNGNYTAKMAISKINGTLLADIFTDGSFQQIKNLVLKTGLALASNQVGVDLIQGDRLLQQAEQCAYGDSSVDDETKCLNLMKKAASLGNSVAQERVAMMLYEGYGSLVDYEGALKMFLQAASSGEVVSIYRAAEMYQNGIGTESNIEIAIKLYELAMEIGSVQFSPYAPPVLFIEPYIELAKIHYNGEGVQPNRQRGVDLIKFAYLNGNIYTRLESAKFIEQHSLWGEVFNL